MRFRILRNPCNRIEGLRVSQICGVFGIAGNGIIQDDVRAFNFLGRVSTVRGLDSSGYYEINTRSSKNSEKYFTRVVDWIGFVSEHTESETAKKDHTYRIMNTITCNVMMGHVRQATVGGLTRENAQPIIYGDTVMTHNGTFQVNRYHKEGDRSDSSVFTEEVEEFGFKEVLDSVRDEGAYSIASYNKKTKKLSFIKNGKRPLWFGVNQKRGVLYWASERWMLTMIQETFDSIDFSIWEGNTWKSSAVFSINPGTVFEVDPENIRPRIEIFKSKHVIFSKDDKGKVYWRKELEEKQKIKEEIKALAILQPIEPKEDLNTVIPFAPTNKKVKYPLLEHPAMYKPEPVRSVKSKDGGVDFATLCGACGKKLSVVDQWKIRKNIKSGIQGPSGVYYCECVGTGALKESVNSNKSVH